MPFAVTRVFSDDISIDLGTANTLVHVQGRGIIIDEPSLVAVRARGVRREVLAVGQRARTLLGRAPEPLEAVRPLRDGTIADFLAAEEMLRQFIGRAKTMLGFLRTRILICVPAGATPLERRAVYDTSVSAGARQTYLVAEPVAAALGAGLDVDKASGYMVVDVGGGTTDIAVMKRGRIVAARSLRCAGNAMDQAIVRYVRRRHQLLISEASAERIKIEAGAASAARGGRNAEIHIRGRELREGRPTSVVLGPEDIVEALGPPIAEIAEFVQRALEDLPPDVAADICERGIQLSGGGALLEGLDTELERLVGVKFYVPEHPMHCVVKGSALIMEELSGRRHLLLAP